MIKKDTDHSGLKELIIQEVIENEDFDYRKEDVVKVILDKIENFVEESKWTKNVRLAREFLDFKQQDGEDMLKYVVRFSALEAKLKNEKILMSNLFKTGVLLNQSKISKSEKSNIMASIDMNNEIDVLDKVKKKIRENHEVNKEVKETFAAVKEDTKEPLQALYGERQGDFRNQNSKFGNQGRGKSSDREFKKDGNSFYDRNRGRSRERRNSQDFRRKSWGDKSRSRDRNFGRSNSRDNRGNNQQFQKDGKSPENRIKRTYKVEKLNLDIDKSVFENEIENRMLIDSGCPEMVCGDAWLKTYESSCGKVFQKVGKEDLFRLGNETFKTKKTVKIPFKLGKLEELIDVGVVEANIPMLLSKNKLKEWGARIDFQENTMFIRKTSETIKLN